MVRTVARARIHPVKSGPIGCEPWGNTVISINSITQGPLSWSPPSNVPSHGFCFARESVASFQTLSPGDPYYNLKPYNRISLAFLHFLALIYFYDVFAIFVWNTNSTEYPRRHTEAVRFLAFANSPTQAIGLRATPRRSSRARTPSQHTPIRPLPSAESEHPSLSEKDSRPHTTTHSPQWNAPTQSRARRRPCRSPRAQPPASAR